MAFMAVRIFKKVWYDAFLIPDSPLGPVELALLNLYDRREKRLANKYHSEYKPTPLPDNPTLTSEDVSIIVPTIDTEDTFTECLRLWLANKPKEIIVVTIPRDLARVQQLVQPIAQPDFDKIQVLTVPEANKRAQLIRGIQAATGTILSLVDDDVFWPHDMVLPYLLAPFEDKKVGACGGPQKAHLDDCRKDENVITPWEVAALRAFDGHGNHLVTRFKADGGVWCLVGRTIFVRAEILQNEAFYHDFANEVFMAGKALNTGDDVFITRWVQHVMGWALAIQDCPEATVTTTIKSDAGFAKQMLRWRRNLFLMILTHLFMDPGWFALRRKYPYMAKKMLGRLFRWLHNLYYLIFFLTTIKRYNLLGVLILAWWVFQKYRTYKSFVERYPYCRKHIWAAVLYDYSWIVLDFLALVTVDYDDWLTRNDAPNRG
ncbi:family 2 glycosyltransferase [Coniochaeta ligniaria NRRL 30616]|uniref:Family 2 glycosyltransferase n=1 Tax=Coniochaeta ligniaria NRRL 30616 TaxID=1408157 RepID=A0A1J7ITU9_9PEZI|nr:family 2 glycosyltransferase [Coniochaeta ligniaria NRRL 30616]